jgi:hypothetical protein
MSEDIVTRLVGGNTARNIRVEAATEIEHLREDLRQQRELISRMDRAMRTAVAAVEDENWPGCDLPPQVVFQMKTVLAFSQEQLARAEAAS